MIINIYLVKLLTCCWCCDVLNALHITKKHNEITQVLPGKPVEETKRDVIGPISNTRHSLGGT